MIHAFIGLIVGMMMGMTGAGGAFVAIPLFQISLSSSLKDATALSLITVIVGTGVNLFGRTKVVNWKMVFGFSIFGTFANYMTLPLKMMIPDLMIASLLLIIGSFSIFSVWRSSTLKDIASVEFNLLKILGVGLLMGVVTTLTGLGGGVLLIPFLLRIFGMTYEQALPTSLATILFISLTALTFQGSKTLDLISIVETIYIAGGSIVAFFGLRKILSFFSTDKVLELRKIVFTLSTLASLIVVIIKAFS